MSTVFKGRTFSVEVVRKRFPDGSEHQVEAVRHPRSVVILPMTADGRVILIRQFRPVVDRELWELSAGGVNEAESPEAAAIRECEEEIGLVPRRLEKLCAMFPSPGFCDEEMIFFKVWDLVSPAPDSPHKQDEDERIEVQTFSIAEAKAMVSSGDIVDLKSAYGLTYA